MVYTKPRIRLEKRNAQSFQDFEIQTNRLISTKRPDFLIVNKTKRTRWILDFAVPADHRVQLKESENRDKYLELARELKQLRSMKVTVIPIVIGALDTDTKGLVQGLEVWVIREQMETIQTTALLRLIGILEDYWKLEETCCH